MYMIMIEYSLEFASLPCNTRETNYDSSLLNSIFTHFDDKSCNAKHKRQITIIPINRNKTETRIERHMDIPGKLFASSHLGSCKDSWMMTKCIKASFTIEK